MNATVADPAGSVIGLLYSFFTFKSHSWCILAYVYGSANKQKQLWEFHLVMFRMQSTYLLELTVHLRLLHSLFLFPLWASA